MTFFATLAPPRPVTPSNAAAAILHDGDGRYLLQHRDEIPTIFYPGHWGCFGGAIEPGETPFAGLRRELLEELALDVASRPVTLFSHFRFSIEPAGIEAIDRHYFDVVLGPAELGALRLGEGRAMDLVEGAAALEKLRLVPYDAFALWLHVYRDMVRPVA